MYDKDQNYAGVDVVWVPTELVLVTRATIPTLREREVDMTAGQSIQAIARATRHGSERCLVGAAGSETQCQGHHIAVSKVVNWLKISSRNGGTPIDS